MDYQIVGSFAVQDETTDSISEAVFQALSVNQTLHLSGFLFIFSITFVMSVFLLRYFIYNN